MADTLFDTTFFIDLRRGTRASASVLWEEILAGRLRGSYSPVTVYELWVGQRITREEEVFYESALLLLDEAALTAGASKQAGFWLRGRAPTSAEAIVRDALIAATAVARGETVCTTNIRDFEQFTVAMPSY